MGTEDRYFVNWRQEYGLCKGWSTADHPRPACLGYAAKPNLSPCFQYASGLLKRPRCLQSFLFLKDCKARAPRERARKFLPAKRSNSRREALHLLAGDNFRVRTRGSFALLSLRTGRSLLTAAAKTIWALSTKHSEISCCPRTFRQTVLGLCCCCFLIWWGEGELSLCYIKIQHKQFTNVLMPSARGFSN